MFKKRRTTFRDSTLHLKRIRILKRIQISKITVTIVLLIIFLLLCVYSLFFSGLFTIKVVEFNPKQLSCIDTSIIKSSIPKNTNILFFKTFDYEAILKAKYPCLSSISITKKFPSTILLTLSERQMAAIVRVGIKSPPPLIMDLPIASMEATASTGSAEKLSLEDQYSIDESLFTRTFAVDASGFLLAENPVREMNIPEFYFVSEQDVEINSHLEAGVIESAISLIQKLGQQQIIVENAKIENGSLFINGPIRITFLLKKGQDAQIIPLQLILQKAKIDSETVEKIDLRFDKPVVVYKKNQAGRSKQSFVTNKN